MDKLKAAEWEVRPVGLQTAERLVAEHHYARGGSNTATFLHGLFRAGEIFDGQCVGVAWWIPPTRSAAEATFPERWQGVLALSRLVIEPGIPKNACSFLLARSRKMIPAEDWPCLVTYADEWRGHEGAIYRADNWTYCGKTRPERTYTLNGRMIARKAGPTTRTHAQMVALGAELAGSFAKHKFVMVRSPRRPPLARGSVSALYVAPCQRRSPPLSRPSSNSSRSSTHSPRRRRCPNPALQPTFSTAVTGSPRSAPAASLASTPWAARSDT